MSEPFIGEIRIFSFPFNPMYWAKCNGALLAVAQNQALYALIGNIYGGNTTNFNIPDLQDRFPINQSVSKPMGAKGGATTVTLNAANVPSHTHTLYGQNANANSNSPGGCMLAKVVDAAVEPFPVYTSNIQQTQMVALHASTVGPNAGGSTPFSIMPQYLTLNFCISLNGLWPSRS